MGNFYLSKKKKSYILWVIVLVWMVLIFILSSQNGEESAELSSNVTKEIVKTVDRIFNTDFENNPQKLNDAHSKIRSFAHISLFFMLGIFAAAAFSTSITHTEHKQNTAGGRILLYSAALCLVYSISDEIHQIFVPGRGFEIIDLLKDNSGSTAALFIFHIITKK